MALSTGVLCELVLKALILTMSKPFEQALELEQSIGLPTIIANSLAVGFFIYIIKDIYTEQQKAQAVTIQKTLEVLKKLRDISTTGLNATTANDIAQTLHAAQAGAAVSLSDTEKVLAFVGEGADHHVVGLPIVSEASKRAIKDGQMIVINDKSEIGCPIPSCPLTALISAPIVVSGETMGALALFNRSS